MAVALYFTYKQSWDLRMILVEMESTDKDKIKNCESEGDLKTSVTF